MVSLCESLLKLPAETVLINKYRDGGLKMIDLFSFNKSLKTIKKYFDKTNMGKWFNNIIWKMSSYLLLTHCLRDTTSLLPTDFRVFVEEKTILLQHEVSVLADSPLLIWSWSNIKGAILYSSRLKQLSLECQEKLIFASAEVVANTNSRFQEVLKNHKSPLQQKVE